MYANRSLYQYHMWVSGILFGAGHFHVLKQGGFSFSDIRMMSFYAISISIWASLYLIKHKNRGSQLAELSRANLHIFADFLCSVGSVSVFAVLTYNIVVSANPMITDYELSLEISLLIFNVLCFCAGYILLRVHASDERKTNFENSSQQKKSK